MKKVGKPFEKGNPGKSKGTEHKATKKAKEIILTAIDEMAPDFKDVMNELKGSDKKTYVQVMVKLFDFVLPKRLDIVTEDKKTIDVSKLPDGDLDRIIGTEAGS